MPEIRRSQEQLGNLPGIQDAYVADTTATAKAAIAVGRMLQNNQAIEVMGDVFQQKERRNVEDAYMRLQSANNAHLNGGKYSLTGDPMDQEEGGGFLTRRGKQAEGSDEEYRATMQKTADRLTAKMSTTERLQFQKLYSHTTEQSLSALRRNTEQEMLRYKSELTDATLQSAAAANLSTAVNAYAGQQSFNGGALSMVQRQAGATGDASAITATQTAIAQVSQTQAIGAVNEWYNKNVMEIDRAADFMRSQGMDEKTIAWRKQEFLQQQGASMAEALTAQGMYDHADNFLANADKVGLTNPEAVGKLKLMNERMRAASIEKKNRVADETANVMLADIAQLQIQNPLMMSREPDKLIATLQMKANKISDPRVLNHIVSLISSAEGIKARRAEDAARDAKEQAKIVADLTARETNSPLKIGGGFNDKGEVVVFPPEYYREKGTQLYNEGKITAADHDEYLVKAGQLSNKVAFMFQQDCVNQIMPVFAGAIKLEKDGFQINDAVDPKTGKPKYPFDMKSGLTDTNPDAPKGFFSVFKPRKNKEAILLSQTVEYMNAIRERLSYDKNYTLEQAKQEFREATMETTEEAKKIRIMTTIQKARGAAHDAFIRSTTRALK